ncbi:MAG TPA: hypothetical protein VJ953_17310 [Saprospiraceae bacterium]|nr:hypothetical protein [Saprospiraceae bacterium]
MEIINKIKWALTLLLVFFSILATNLIDKNNFRKIKTSVVTIYEDRIVANDLIFEYLLLTHEKELALAASDQTFFSQRNPEVNQELNRVTEQYEATKLTKDEAISFGALREDLDQLMVMEESINISTPKEAYRLLLSDIKKNLDKLAQIQLEEGRKQMTMSRNTFKEVESFTRIENYCLIALAILIPIIIFGSTRPLKKYFQ